MVKKEGRGVREGLIFKHLRVLLFIYASGTSMAPSSTCLVTSTGSWPSTVTPTLFTVPNTSLTVPAKDLAIERGLITRAMWKMSFIFKSPWWGQASPFLWSRAGSLSALITSEAAEGMTLTWASRPLMVNLTVTRRPFQSVVALAISSPIFLGDYENAKKLFRSVQRKHKANPTIIIIIIVIVFCFFTSLSAYFQQTLVHDKKYYH